MARGRPWSAYGWFRQPDHDRHHIEHAEEFGDAGYGHGDGAVGQAAGGVGNDGVAGIPLQRSESDYELSRSAGFERSGPNVLGQ